MKSIQIDPRWRVQLEGDADDIADLERALNGSAADPGSYVIYHWEDVPTLTTIAWDHFSEPQQAEAAARSALKLFGGLLSLYNLCGPISTGTVYEVLGNGRFHMTRTTELTIRVKPPEEDRIAPAAFARVMSLVDDSSWLASALIELNGDTDWFDVYRAIEAIEARFNHSEQKMKNSPLIDGPRLKLVKQTANAVRHLPSEKHRAPEPPIHIHTAVQDVKAAIIALINFEINRQL
ncbi:hypothetical protein [uncultured Novosphingobium sp.]|uniref:hypothetical protein n=1 Tax=uncultured Novosphingobium sp. TaxID=292277 RepID=UPI0037487A11